MYGPAIGTTVYVYDAFNRLAAEYTDGAAAAAPCQICYLSTDYLGSVRLVTNETGATVGLHDYLPFGEEIPGNTAGRDGTFGGFERVRQRFTGQERDETNLDFFQARYSAATLGRFLSPDPANAGVDLLNPQSWNGYSYVVNNPLSLTDPTGLFALQDPRPAPEPDPGPDPGDFFNYCFVFSCGRGGFGLGDGLTSKPPIVFLQPVKNNFRVGQDGSKASSNGMTKRFLPGNAQSCTGMGKEFYAPPQFNLSQVVRAGQAGGRFNLVAMNRAVGHFGTFDYQRVGNPASFTFYSGYTPVSNIDVGAYLQGAGFSESQAGTISNGFARLFSSNAGDPQQTVFRNLGYEIASGKGSYSCSAIPQ